MKIRKSGGIITTTGTGTSNTIPKYSGAAALTNSSVSDNGTVVSTTEAIQAGVSSGFKLGTAQLIKQDASGFLALYNSAGAHKLAMDDSGNIIWDGGTVLTGANAGIGVSTAGGPTINAITGQNASDFRVNGIQQAYIDPTGNIFVVGTANAATTATSYGNSAAGDATISVPTGKVLRFKVAGGSVFVVDNNGAVSVYRNVTSVGWGVPAIYGYGRSTGQIAGVASVATYTVGAADGSFIVSANVLVTTATTHNFTVTCAYTDEGGTARTITFNFQVVGGTIGTGIVNTGGAVPYEGFPIHIRAKALTAITIATTGTFTTVTYNVEGLIQQVA